MERIGICGKCLKTICYCGLVECEFKDDGVPNYSFLKTIDEIKEIGKESVIFELVKKNCDVRDGWSIIRKEDGLYDVACKEL